jgi:hypothetical protein
MLYNELEQGDILSGVRWWLALLAYADILLGSIWAMRRIRQTPVKMPSYTLGHWSSVPAILQPVPQGIGIDVIKRQFLCQTPLLLVVKGNILGKW